MNVPDGIVQLLVWFLIRVVEKRTVSSQDFGLQKRRNRLSHIGLGVLLALVFYTGPLFLGQILGWVTVSNTELLSRLNVQTTLEILAL